MKGGYISKSECELENLGGGVFVHILSLHFLICW